MIARTAEIKLTIGLDADNLPVNIEWEATEARDPGPAACQSMMLSLWDSEEQSMAAINLWTKSTTVEEMNRYFYQVFHKLADTYLQATQNEQLAESMHAFGEEFAKSTELIAPMQESGTDARRR